MERICARVLEFRFPFGGRGVGKRTNPQTRIDKKEQHKVDAEHSVSVQSGILEHNVLLIFETKAN